MNRILISIAFCLWCFSSYAQDTTVILKIIEKGTGLPLIGATAYIENLGIGASSDKEGKAVLKNVPLGEQVLRIAFIGFETITDTILVNAPTPVKTYFLQEDPEELDAVVVTVTRSTRTVKKIPTRIEFIGKEELEEKAIMNAANISMVLRESTGIQIQQTSLSSGNSSIRIQGLDGRYTQILKDGFPLFGGFSGGLSINQVPPLDLGQFEVIKGSASTLYGGGAIAGLVNLVSKTPEEGPELDIQLAQTHVGGSTANLFYSHRKNKIGYTLYGAGHRQQIYEPDNDGFSNIPKTQTFSFNPRVFYYPSENQIIWVGLNGTFDRREGGDITAIENGANGIHQYTEKNVSSRISSQAVYEKTFSNERILQLKNSISYFDRELTTPDLLFAGSQLDVFTEVNYSIGKESTDWIIGGNLYNNSFREKDNTLPRDQENTIFGAFVNNTLDLSEKYILESGFRADHSPDWGLFPLPRISLLWKPNNQFSSRIGGGMGYKIPDIFTEEAATRNFENVRPIDNDDLNAERSYGANIDFNYVGAISDDIIFSINQLFYLTSIDNALLLNGQADGSFMFQNADGVVLSKGLETNIKFTFHDFRWFLNYANIRTTLNYLPDNPQKPLTPQHQAGSVLMYENEKWRIGYETYYTGKQNLSSGDVTQDFFTMGLLVQGHFKWASPYINFENFTDRRQSRFSSEVSPPHQTPRFTEIYAPTDGFVFTLGVVIKPFGREEEH